MTTTYDHTALSLVGKAYDLGITGLGMRSSSMITKDARAGARGDNEGEGGSGCGVYVERC